MKTITFIFLFFACIGISAQSETKVHGYRKKNGTYVLSHKRTKENQTEKDNWSSKPNYNPHTGKKGTR